jgi:3D (Asp-Asp-Asp) domain-containing protein
MVSMVKRAVYLLFCPIPLFAQAIGASISAPDLSNLKPISFWATSYSVHHAENTKAGIPLRDLKERVLGPMLSRLDWCVAALEGTVRVDTTTYNYAGSTTTDFVDCSQYFTPKVGYSRFSVARGPFGDGARGFMLVPYRTVAADPSFLKSGAVIFIPSALGQTLPEGQKHDGYFFVGDVGGAIKGNHLDIFQGDRPTTFPFIRSTRTPVFRAFVITDPHVIEGLKKMHTFVH